MQETSRAYRGLVHTALLLGVTVMATAILLRWLNAGATEGSLLVFTAYAVSSELAVWCLAAGIIVCIYLGLSVADTGILIHAAILASIPALWLVPSILLLWRNSAAVQFLGVLLFA